MTPAQILVVRADIAAKSDLSIIPLGSDGSDAIAKLYNLPSSPVITVWRTDAPAEAIFDSIDWSKYTPNDAADTTTLFTNRALTIQTKQMNLQNMLVGRSTINAAKVNIRSGLRDAVTALPAGTLGASVSAGGTGGATVLNACTRTATRLEALLCTGSQGSDTTGTVTARVMTFEGATSYSEIDNVRGV